jgi:hypothetical protein
MRDFDRILKVRDYTNITHRRFKLRLIFEKYVARMWAKFK